MNWSCLYLNGLSLKITKTMIIRIQTKKKKIINLTSISVGNTVTKAMVPPAVKGRILCRRELRSLFESKPRTNFLSFFQNQTKNIVFRFVFDFPKLTNVRLSKNDVLKLSNYSF